MVRARMPMAIHPFHARMPYASNPVIDLALCTVLAVSLVSLFLLAL